MFGWLGCWASAQQESLSNSNTFKANLACLKMSFLGLFLFTEMLVLVSFHPEPPQRRSVTNQAALLDAITQGTTW